MNDSCLFLVVAGALQALASACHAMTFDCSALAQMPLPKARIESAQPVAVNDKLALWTGGEPVIMSKAFCRVRGKAAPVKGSSIGFEVWLPLASEWNGKFQQAGNGGFAGGVPLPSLFDAVMRGYAVAATDGGHVHPNGLSAEWALGQPERVVDFGWRAVRQTTLAARRIVSHAYRRAPRKSYFVGCSDGGRDALMVAQRFPKEFDGIVAGAPAADWVGLMAGGALLQRDLAPPKGELPVAKLAALQAASLAACAGGAAFIADPAACHFDPAVLACTGEETAACLTPTQLAAVRRVYEGPLDPSTGHRLYGLSPGAEAESGNWDFWVLQNPSNPLGGKDQRPYSINQSFFRYIVRAEPAFTLADLTEADIVAARRRWSATLDATNPDLRAFKARGGKLLQYHGWTDSAIPPRMTLDYFQAVQQRMGDTSGFHRLFMVPGMNHCAGGAGPWQVDWLGALERWVERGEEPAMLTARHPQGGATQTLRPHPAR